MTRRAILFLATVLLGACTDDGAGSVSEGALGPGVAAQADPKTVVLETDTGGADARAGVAFFLKCRTFLPPPAGSKEPYGEEVFLPVAATVVVLGGPAAPMSVSGMTVKFSKVGAYPVACALPTIGRQDATPATLHVVPGPPVSVETALLGAPDAAGKRAKAPAQVEAGTPLLGQCAAADGQGNDITEGFSLAVLPEPTPLPLSLAWMPTTTGAYTVACKVEGLADPTPVSLDVVPAAPRHLFTVLEPSQIPAGNAASLQCVANDAFGNVVEDFPFALDLAPALKVKGLYVTATLAGLHLTRCVPESLAWDLFTLHPATLTVVPGPPFALEVGAVPAKQVYKREEKVQFLTSVRDIFANLIPTAKVSLTVVAPKTGWVKKSDDLIQFNVDATYDVHAEVVGAADVAKNLPILVDGAPPLLTIDWPGWGATVTGKPSIQIKGTAGDEGSGLTKLTVNGKTAYADGANQWLSQQPAAHGLNATLAEALDQGGEKAKATRGFYYSGQYYPTDAGTPNGALVPDGMQVFLGKDFFDDGVHDPAHPDDMATLIEVVLGSLDVATLLPPNISQGDMEVTLSNTAFGKPKVTLKPIDGGISMLVVIPDIHTDLKVKAKQKLGPIKVTLKVSGDIKIAKVTIATTIKVNVMNGQAKVAVEKSSVDIDGMKLHVDGIAGLFDFLWNILLKSFTKDLENQLIATLNGQIPKLVGGMLQQMAISQTLPLPALLPGQPTATMALVSELKTLVFTPAGGHVHLDAGFVSQKGTNHTLLGAIGRAGCIGTVTDAFAIDPTQRMQIALHDDVLNQAFYAVWYAGALQAKNLPASALGLAADPGSSPIPGVKLDTAKLNIDFFLPPIVETCGAPTPMDIRLQVGDLFGQIVLEFGGDELALGLFASLDVGAKLALVPGKDGGQAVAVTTVGPPKVLTELVSVSPGFEEQLPFFAKLIDKELQKALTKGVPGLDKLQVDLPSLDLGGLLPGMPAGAKIGLKIKKLQRAGGYTALDAALE